MRRLGFYMTLTADGMYADRGGGLGWYDSADDEHIYANGLMRDAGAVVIGRIMYEVFEHLDMVDLDDPAVPAVERDFATFWRQTPKHVVSRGRPTLRPNATLVDGDVVDAVRRLKDEPGPDLLLGGGAELLAALSGPHLVDDYRLLVTPTGAPSE